MSVPTPDLINVAAPAGSGLVAVNVCTPLGCAGGVQFRYPRAEAGPNPVLSQPGGIPGRSAPPTPTQVTLRPRPF